MLRPSRVRLLEERWVFLHEHVVHGLEVEPSSHAGSNLVPCVTGDLMTQDNRFSNHFSHHLALAASFSSNEPPDTFVDGLTDGQQTVVTEDAKVAVSKSFRESGTFISVGDRTVVVLECRLLLIERTGVLRDGEERHTLARETLAPHTVRMRSSECIRSRMVHRRVDRKRGGIDGPAHQDLSLGVDETQVGGFDLGEVHAVGVDPEAISHLGIADSDVPCHSLVKSIFREKSESGSEPLFSVETFLLDGVEGGGFGVDEGDGFGLAVRGGLRGHCCE